jgi:hypothetical protein
MLRRAAGTCLLQVEDLDMVIKSLTTDDNVMLKQL